MEARIGVRPAFLLILSAAVLFSACNRAGKAPEQANGTTVKLAPPPQNVGETPMGERVAVIGLLNKRNGIVRNLTMKPGQALRIRDAVVRLRACETTAPWETPTLTGAFVQLDVEQTNHQWKRVFSGWLYKESPSLNAVEHPVYDVWPKSCTMSWPDAPAAPAGAKPSTEARSASKASSAKKSGVEVPAPIVTEA
ncbi:MAG: DUF2155 domain-containing protein, partial [Sphingomicrobium sp.]